VLDMPEGVSVPSLAVDLITGITSHHKPCHTCAVEATKQENDLASIVCAKCWQLCDLLS